MTNGSSFPDACYLYGTTTPFRAITKEREQRAKEAPAEGGVSRPDRARVIEQALPAPLTGCFAGALCLHRATGTPPTL